MTALAAPRTLPHLLALLLLAVLVATSGRVHGADEVPLAIKGYDTVAYFTMNKAVPGKAELEYVWDEQRYRFANAEHLAKFKSDPARYAPRFGNLCASSLAMGQAYQADPEIWLVSEGRLYLFGVAASKDAFVKDPKAVLAAAERNAERLRKGQPLVKEYTP